MSKTVETLKVLLADTYALYLKTQNYHWHVTGPNFKELHTLFEEHYKALAIAVDDVAERILILGDRAPATFAEFNNLKTLKDGDSSKSASDMVNELHDDHGSLNNKLREVLSAAQAEADEGTIALMSELLSQHEKARWMLGASRA